MDAPAVGFLLRNFEVTSLIRFRQPTVHRYSQRNTVVSSREDAPYPFSQPLHEHHLRSASLCSGTTPSSNCTSMIDVPCEGYIISPDSTGRRRGRTAIQRVKCPVLTLELSTTARMLPALRSIVPVLLGKEIVADPLSQTTYLRGRQHLIREKGSEKGIHWFAAGPCKDAFRSAGK